MNERHIRHIRNQFILISTLSFFGVMLLMGGMIYGFSEYALRNEVREITAYLSDHEVEISELLSSLQEEGGTDSSPSALSGSGAGSAGIGSEVGSAGQGTGEDGSSSGLLSESERTRIMLSLPRLFGRDWLYSSTLEHIRGTSFFTVLFDEENHPLRVNRNLIFGLDDGQAVEYALQAKEHPHFIGHIGRFYYSVFTPEEGQTLVIFVDRTAQLTNNYRILFASMSLLAVGTLLAFFIMRILSQRVVQSEMENADRQKRFITNASHELKTPLAVIRANTEMQEMMEGESEWTASNLRQVERMSGLVENLIKIARAEERDSLEMALVNVAQVTEETASSFRAVASSEEKTLETEIPAPFSAFTDESILRQLLTLLLDNAVKYCDGHGKILCGARKNGRIIDLWVSNDYAKGEKVDTRQFFDRFYREDASHNEKGGYGIGLSIAESLVGSLHGKLDVSWKDGRITFRAQLPEGKVPAVRKDGS